MLMKPRSMKGVLRLNETQNELVKQEGSEADSAQTVASLCPLGSYFLFLYTHLDEMDAIHLTHLRNSIADQEMKRAVDHKVADE